MTRHTHLNVIKIVCSQKITFPISYSICFMTSTSLYKSILNQFSQSNIRKNKEEEDKKIFITHFATKSFANISIPKLPKPSLVRLYYQFTPPPPRRHATPRRRLLTTKCSQARPGASKPARDSTFGIQEALGSQTLPLGLGPIPQALSPSPQECLPRHLET